MNESIKHIKLINELAEYCEKYNLIIFEHEYNYMAFGSWSVIIGKSKHRIKFSWDGKESYLGIGLSSFQNSNSIANWEPVFPSVSGTQKTEKEVFNFIKETLAKQYAK
jgi:hypothetical protein